MDVNGPTDPPASGSTLASLAQNVREARDKVRTMRAPPVDNAGLLSARHALLGAMEAYVEALTSRRLPVPHQLHDDLRLLREIRRHPDGRWWATSQNE